MENLKQNFRLLMVLVCSSLLISCTVVDKELEVRKEKDLNITQAVKLLLTTNKKINATNVEVLTKNSIVTVRGKVKTHEQQKLAVKIAASVAGVTKVNNEIVVNPK